MSAAEKELLLDSEIAEGYRLACRTSVLSDSKVYIPPEALTTEQRLQVEGVESKFQFDPPITVLDVEIERPGLQDLRADANRVLRACSEAGYRNLSFGPPLLKTFSETIRRQEWTARIVSNGDEILGILPRSAPIAGLAVDVGTTKLAAYLIDLENGATLSKVGLVNPQVVYGDDVVNRIAYANEHSHGRETLQAKLAEAINEMIANLISGSDLGRDQVVEAVVVGNTAMHHLFTGLAVKQLGEAPYVPALSDSMTLRAQEIGLQLSPGSRVYLPPNVAGYVGADHVAMLLATDIWRSDRPAIAVDIGTNTEVSLAVDGRLLTCSCASGPAFEGAHIQHGMRAAPGAIERVEIHGESVYTQTIDGKLPTGICGSGILDAVAEMRLAGVIDGTGRLNPEYPGVQSNDSGGVFSLVSRDGSGNGRAITLSRKDVNEIQLAKAAIRAGMEILLWEAGLKAEEIESFVIAGAFGTYIDIENAIRIGMLPRLPLERFQQVGNAAGMGAREMLISKNARLNAERIAERINYVELTVHPNFFDVYANELMF
jgi:uncharacterized 2Fe-2S/4Fe-4S cluster protein (DUF4445 family)